MRSDAQRNRDRVLAAARAEFAEHGAAASLNRVAQQAGVGPGTLYRHFPSIQALLVEIIREDVEALCARGETLLDTADPGTALREWLRAVAVHASAMRGFVAVELLSGATGLAECHDRIRAIGASLLNQVGGSADIDDVLTVVNAVAWANEQSHGDADRLDRLLALATHGLGGSDG